MHQDINLHARLLDAGQTARYQVPSTRYAWLHVARGSVEVNGKQLRAGDAAALESGEAVELRGQEPAEVLLFDLA